jgi:hypothetical protein
VAFSAKQDFFTLLSVWKNIPHYHVLTSAKKLKMFSPIGFTFTAVVAEKQPDP